MPGYIRFDWAMKRLLRNKANSKLVTEYINCGEGCHNVRNVYSINIVYFSLGSGRDTVYHGKTEFHGMKADGLPVDVIAKYTGLSVPDIEKL